MGVDLLILNRLLRAVAVQSRLIVYTELSEQYEQETGTWIDPHLGWRFPMAEIAKHCASLCRPRHQPILSALVINNPEGQLELPGRPGMGFWGLQTDSGQQLTPAEPSEEAWIGMVAAVHRQVWPVDLDDLSRDESV